MKKILFLMPLLLPIQSCNDADATSVTPAVEYEVLHEINYNKYGDITSKSTTRISSESEYESELLKRSSESTQSVDFETESVLLVDMGLQSSGGYGLSATFTENEDHVLASVVYQFPGAGCTTTQALTNPTKIFKLKSTKYILITEEITYSTC